MIVEVEMKAFCAPGTIRKVDVPDSEWEKAAGNHRTQLDLVFHYGQNDFQPQQIPSVSVGDIIRISLGRFKVVSFGFEDVEESLRKRIQEHVNKFPDSDLDSIISALKVSDLDEFDGVFDGLVKDGCLREQGGGWFLTD